MCSPSPPDGRRPGALPPAGLALLRVLLILLVTSPCYAGGEPATTELDDALLPDRPVERPIRHGEVHSFRLELPPEAGARVAVRGVGIKIALRLLDDEGSELDSADTRFGDEWPEQLWLEPGAAGDLRLEIEVSEYAIAEAGRFHAELVPQPVDDRLRLAVAASRAMRRGNEARSRQESSANQAAIAAFTEARELWRRLDGGERDEAEALISLGAVALQLGDYPRARAWLDEAADLLESLGAERRAIDARAYAGWAVYRLGDTGGALARFDEVLAASRRHGHRRMEAFALATSGTALAAAGDHQRALDRLRAARRLFGQLGASEETQTLHNIGSLYRALGEPRRAAEVYREVLARHRAEDDVYGQASTLTGLGLAMLQQQEPAQAAAAFRESLSLRERLGDRFGQAEALRSLGTALRALGEPLEAAGYLERALALDRETGSVNGQAATLAALAEVRFDQRRYEDAKRLFGQSLDGWRASLRQREIAASLHGLARCARALGRGDEALRLSERALMVVESLRTTPKDPALRASLFATTQEIYTLAVELHMDRHLADPEAGEDVRAFELAERARARALLDTLGADPHDRYRDADPELVARERRLAEEVAAAVARSLERPGEPAAGEGGAEVATLLGRLTEVQIALRAQSPAVVAMATAGPAGLDEIRDRLLGDGDALLHYLLAEPRSYLWIVTADGLTSRILPGRGVIEAAAATYRQRLLGSHRRSEAHAAERAGAALAELLVEPAWGDLGGARRLLIAAPAALQSIPFAALPIASDRGSKEPLVSRFEVSYVPSASTLMALRRRSRDRPGRRSLALVADPVFSPDDARVQPAGGEPASVAEDEADAEADDFDAPVRRQAELGAWPLPRLASTGAEAAAIRSLAPAYDVLLALGFDADRELVLSPDFRMHRILHLATHSLVDAQRPELSGLVLSLYDPHGGRLPGFVGLYDLYRVDLQADLVVLSACATALGQELPGEGQISLARGFLYAGARTVIVSLWEVDDAATTELMTRFYRHLLTAGQSPGQALSQAQREMAQHPRWHAPFYWAGFIVQGDHR